jgi:hypothetical protein
MDFMTTEAEEVLYGGAKGGGKSHGLRAWGVNYCLTYPGAQIVLFRRTFKQLEDTHLLKIQREIPASLAHYVSAKHDLIFPNGAIFQFRYCEKSGDERAYDSAEYDAMLFDEITAFELFQYTYLISRCRSIKPWWPGRRIRAGGTPLGVGHAWVKARFVTPKPPVPAGEIWQTPAKEGGLTRQFIPAKATDNTTLLKADPEYPAFLRSLPPEEYRAAMGDWEAASGQFFTIWNPQVHVVTPFDIDPEWDRYICVDYGYGKPYGCYWFARPPDTSTAYVYREHYGKGVESKEQARRARMSTDDACEKIRAVVLDPSMFNKVNVRGERVDSIADDWKAAFGGTTSVLRGHNERIFGWNLMRKMLNYTERPDGSVLIPPRLFFFDTCENAIRTIPEMVVDKHNAEDIDTDGEDHAGDAIRYGMVHAFAGAGKPGMGRRYYQGPGGIEVREI